LSNRPFLLIIVFLAVAIGVAWFASSVHPGGDPPPAEKEAEDEQQKADAEKAAHDKRQAQVDHSPQAFDKVKEGAVRATMEIEGRGTLVLEFYPKAAPKSVAHITDLIKQHFYDGIKVHRIVPSKPAVIQMGDPYSKGVDPGNFTAAHIGEHGSGKTVPLEVLLPHKKYSIGMARSQDLDSADSQFYINTDDNSGLDGEYCVFGQVIQGMDVLPSIKLGDKIKSLKLN